MLFEPDGRPQSGEYAIAYAGYVDLVSETRIVTAMQDQLESILELLRGISEEEAGKLHPPYTWTIKQVVGHLIDAERIFGYRALRFARNDSTELPGFDENSYVANACFDAFPLAELVDEFELLRRSHIHLFRHLAPDAWPRTGMASNASISVLALAYILVGHVRHHSEIVRKRLAGTAL